MRLKNDARKSPRHKSALLVKFQPQDDKPAVEVQNLSDVSLGGFKFLTDSELNPGEIRNISVLIPNADDPIEIGVGIVRVEKSDNSNYKYEVGAEFCHFHGVDKQLLDDYLKFEAEKKGFFGFFKRFLG